MRQLLTILFALFCGTLISQNTLPLTWELQFPHKTQKVNLLLSWERQGISHLDGEGKLQNQFIIAEPDSPIYLQYSLRCNIKDILINGHSLNIQETNEFIWSATPNYPVSKHEIPKKFLHFNQSNEIVILANNFSYTGGKSNNWAEIGHDLSPSEINISFPNQQHLFGNSTMHCSVHGKTTENNSINILIRNAFADTVYQEKHKINTSEFNLNLNKTQLQPGTYEILACTENDDYVGTVAFFAVSPERIENKSQAPEGFNGFWDKAEKELAGIEPEFKITKVDSLCTQSRNGYVVEMKSLGNVTIRGYYFVPKAKGTYPAILNLPGYGYGFEYLDEFLQVKDPIIELALCVRGHGISKEALQLPEMPGIFGHNVGFPEQMPYRDIFMDCRRGLEFLLSRTEVDKSKIGTFGGSQGGGLALVTAGMNPKDVTACAYFDPFPCDLTNVVKIRTMVKTEIENFIALNPKPCTFEQAMHSYLFFDAQYFAQSINCLVHYFTGLADDDIPSHLGFSAYNRIKSAKTFTIYPFDSHIGESNYKKDAMKWFWDVAFCK
jgi:cephalosporin-C deacetylase-like acetyl esterase